MAARGIAVYGEILMAIDISRAWEYSPIELIPFRTAGRRCMTERQI